MSKTSELRAEVEAKQDEVRKLLLACAVDCVDAVLAVKPDANLGMEARLSPNEWASLRWAMLKAGFHYCEIENLLTKLNQAKITGTYPSTADQWIDFVDTNYLGKISDVTDYFTLVLLNERYSQRLTGSRFNAHEKMVFTTAKQINRILDSRPKEEHDDIIKALAKSAVTQPEMVWRVATGGLRTTSFIIAALMRALIRLESAMLVAQDEATK